MSRQYNSGYNGKFDKRGNLIRNGASQSWNIGDSVNVGFVKGLTVRSKDADGSYTLESAKGVFYSFEPHGGLFRLNGPSIS